MALTNRRMLELVLPWPPSINHYWKHRVIGKRAQVYLSAEGVAFKKAVIDAVFVTAKKENVFDGRLSVELLLHPPTLRKYDIDNRIKSTLDAITNAGIWIDDEQIDQLKVTRGEKVKGGEVIILIMDI